MIYIVFDKTDRGCRKPFHSLEATFEDAQRVVQELRESSASTHAKALIFWETWELGAAW